MKANIQPALLRWARERASLTKDALAAKMHVQADRVEEWENTGDLTFKQTENIAHHTHTPIGFLFLPNPPVEALPIPDFRTLGSHPLQRFSPDLLDVIHRCQTRQDWYHDYLVANGATPLPFVGGNKVGDSIQEVASSIRAITKIDTYVRARAASWEDALRMMFELTEEAGILVMRNGVVGNNNKRKLSVEEFRGFVLCDTIAPLIFINASDTKAAQMFTLAHELAHVWIGQSGVSNLSLGATVSQATEAFCNRVAAEVLVPLAEFRQTWRPNAEITAEVKRLSGRFKVSTLVVYLRAYDAGFLPREEFQRWYDDEARKLTKLSGGGGDFYLTQTSRLGKRFPKALIENTLEGRTSFREAFRLLGLKKMETFQELAKHLSFPS